MWTLTQTEDTLWYHVYRRHEDPDLVNGRKRRYAENSQKSGKKLKDIADVKEEEDEMSLGMTSEKADKDEEVLRDYFQLSVKMEDLYKEWGDADPHFSHIGNIFSGKLSELLVFTMCQYFMPSFLLSVCIFYCIHIYNVFLDMRKVNCYYD